jgi:ribosomal protein S18 acetylase RimI-like enzyme
VLESVEVDAAEWREELVDRATARAEVWHRDSDAARAAAAQGVDEVLSGSEVHRLVSDGREVGWCWLGRVGNDLVLRDLAPAEGLDVDDLRNWLLGRARSAGRAGFQASAGPGEPTARRLIEHHAFGLVATNMCLELDRPPAPEVGAQVRLEPMSPAAFAAYLEGSAREYAAERQAAGEPLEDAERIAEQTMVELLPEGLGTAGQHLFTTYADGTDAGLLWLATDRAVVYVYDVEILDGLRGRGLGRAVMNAAAAWSAERGAPAIGLNVFSHNHTARRLYDRLGYRVVRDQARAALD